MTATERGSFLTRAATRLARRSKAFEVSPWSAAWEAIADHPDGIYFGNGAPAPEVVPLERLKMAAARAWSEAGDSLDYGELEGYAPLRELIAERMKLRGVSVSPSDIMVTNGSQQGIDLIAKLFIDPGDAIIVEGPTYIGAMQVFDAYEAEYVVAPVDDEGIDVEGLARLLASTDVRPKLLYTVPTFQNPTGTSLSPARRAALLELSREYGFVVVEDDPYGELYYDRPPEPALRAEDPSVMYLGTFSKTIAPALRVGWVIVPPALMDLMLMAKEGADIHTNRVVMRTVYHAAHGFLDEHVADLRTMYRRRRDALLEGLREHAPEGVRWITPRGGFFVWVELPNHLNADHLLPIAAAHGVAFLPGAWFYPGVERPASGLRLSFSALTAERIAEGTRRLGAAFQKYLALEG
ncbi:MAG: PLP-dependent aminotransferase family protein [Chloroflexota bacterium]